MRAVQALLTCVLTIASAMAPTLAQGAGVERIRHATSDGHTRVVIDLDGAAEYKATLLAADPKHSVPARFFVDLTRARLGKAVRRDVRVGDGRIARIRVGQYDERTTRVVIELAGRVRPKVFTLASPPRVVMDFAGRAVAPAQRSAPKAAEKPKAPSAATTRNASAVRTSPAPAKPAVPAASRSAAGRRARIVLDPGHGGRDPGAVGVRGATEKYLTYDIATRVARKLRTRLNAEVLLTRTNDSYISLPRRKDAANHASADAFVSIHCNAARNSKANGIETYYLKNTNDRATLRLARLENGVDALIDGADVSNDADLPYILSDMVQGYKEADSRLLAGHVQRELVRQAGTRYKSVKDLGVKQGPFYVLDGTYMPAILVETAFVTNATEAARLRSPEYRDTLAEGIYRGIERYLQDNRVAAVY